MLLEAVLLTVVAIALVQAIRLFLSDCDLSLQWAEKFGLSVDCLKGKVVWVTGASSGIGESLVYELASVGCRLVLSARREEELNRVKKQCLEKFPRVREDDILVLPLDLLDRNSHQQAADTVIKYFKQVDYLVNNAGRSQRALFSRTSVEVDREMLELNTLGPLSLTKRVLPHMESRKQGHVVVVSSVAAKFGSPGLGSYCGSKFALHGLFDTLRIEGYPDNIKVTLVCPGPVFSNILKVAFTGTSGTDLGVEMKADEHRMATDRCAHLTAVAMANSLDEVWVALHPELFYCYLFQYLPAIAKRIAVVLGQNRCNKIRQGSYNLH